MKYRAEVNFLADHSAVIETYPTSARITTTDFDGATYYFEIVAKVAAGQTATVSLRREGTTTDDATITVTETSFTRKRSASFTPPAGSTNYFVFASVTDTTGSRMNVCKVVILQSSFTKTAPHFNGGHGSFTGGDQTTYAPITVPHAWLYTAANWDGTITWNAEAWIRGESDMETMSCELQEDDGAFGSWTSKVVIGSAATATNVRIAATFTPTDGRNYRFAYKTTNTMVRARIDVCNIYPQVSGTITKLEMYYTMGMLFPPSAALMDRDQLYDTAEFDGTATWFHEAYGVASGTSDIKLQSDPNGTPTDVTGSTVTDVVERERSSSLTMPSSPATIDAIPTSVGTSLWASTLLATVVLSAPSQSNAPRMMDHKRRRVA